MLSLISVPSLSSLAPLHHDVITGGSASEMKPLSGWTILARSLTKKTSRVINLHLALFYSQDEGPLNQVTQPRSHTDKRKDHTSEPFLSRVAQTPDT